MSGNPIKPQGPLIPGSGNFTSLTVQTSSGTVSSGTNTLSFFGNDPTQQQTLETNAPTMQQDIADLLASYGLVSASTSGRSITFTNQSSEVVKLLVTLGAPVPGGPNLLATLTTSGTAATFEWNIPSTQDANYTFNVWAIPPPRQYTPSYNGYTEIEFGVNQTYPDPENLRDTFNISTVPPGIGSMFNDGPRAAAVTYSNTTAGYSLQQSKGYNAGVAIIPPNNPTLPTQSVSCSQLDGDCPEAVTFPNDTASPKQQTGLAIGSYTVNILDPVVTVWPGP